MIRVQRCYLWLSVFSLAGVAFRSAGGRPAEPPSSSGENATLWTDLPPDDGSVKLSRVETACLAAGRILWPSDGQCYGLLDQGPCQRGEWLVLDQTGTRVGCRPRRCPCDAARHDLCEVEIEPLNSCHVATHAEDLCGPGEQLMVTPRGYGVCGCIARPLHVPWSPDGNGPTARCYPLYQQGPCQPGFQLRFSRSRREPQCQPAVCEDGSVYWPDDGGCYPLGQPGGPCKDDLHILDLDATSLEPVCQLDESRVKRVFDAIPTGVITDAPLSPELITKDCMLDARGRCLRSFRGSSDGGSARPRGGGAGAARGYVSWLRSFRS